MTQFARGAQDDEVIRVAYQHGLAPFCRVIHRPVQCVEVEVGQQGRDDPALRYSLPVGQDAAIFLSNSAASVQSAISGLVVVGCVICALVMMGISIALGVHQFGDSLELTLRLLRIMFPYMLLACLAAAMIGMLNARGHFFIPALGATMLNIVMIASVYFLAPHLGEKLPQQIFALAIGVLAAGAVLCLTFSTA